MVREPGDTESWKFSSTLQVVANGIPSNPANVTIGNLPGNFQLSVSPGSLIISQGGSASATVVVFSLNGFSSATSLTLSGLPSGINASFSPQVVTPPSGGSAPSTLTFFVSSTAPTGTFNVNIFGTSGGQSQTAQLTLNITVPDFTLAVSPASLTLTQNSNGNAAVTVGSVNGSSPTTSLSISGLPSGVTASFAPSSVTPPAAGSAPST